MRRCILFAGYMSEAAVDEPDLFHIGKLSEIGDVYCCYDNTDVNGSAAEQLSHVGAKQWTFEAHGEFDFGSWKRLIALLGWSKIEEYDEVIFVNNSVILLGHLVPFLAQFEAGTALFFSPMLLDEHYIGPTITPQDYLSRVNPYHNNAMFPSVFWAMKAELLRQPFVREFFESIVKQPSRLEVCYQYERGFSRSILRRGIPFELFVKFVYPNSFLYTEVGFGLVANGFPYLKRKALTAEYYPISSLYARLQGLKQRISPEAAACLSFVASDHVKPPQSITNLSDELDDIWYLRSNPDVKAAGYSARLHFDKYGKAEGRAPNLMVAEWRRDHNWTSPPPDKLDEKWYLAQNKDVRVAGLKSRRHYEKFGKAEGRAPNQRYAEWQRRNAEVGRNKIIKEIEFDAAWYLSTYVDLQTEGLDPYEHFVNFGWREGRKPNGYIDLPRYLLDRQHHAGSLEDIMGAILTDREEEYNQSQRALSANYANERKLIIFFNVARDLVGGGMLSINRFVSNARELTEDTGYSIATSGVPLGRKAVSYTKFKAALPQIELRYLCELPLVEDVILFLPEVFSVQFAKDLSAPELAWLLSRKSLKIVVMNQNNDYLPPPIDVQRALFPLTLDVVITTAHKRYCTARNASRYQIPFKQLTPFLPPMTFRSFREKDRIFMLSPDKITKGQDGIDRDFVVEVLKMKLPSFRFVTVENMSLDEYLDLASRAMFSLTFGEGMDGYYIEPILSGGMSFAIYNSTFFPNNFEGKSGLFSSWKVLVDRLPGFVEDLLDPELYSENSANLRDALANEYSNERSRVDLRNAIIGDVDQVPTPWLENSDNFDNIRNYLSTLPGFKFLHFDNTLVCSLPDGNSVRHFGGEFYSVIFEIYIRRDYDIDLPPHEQYILIDVGASFSLATTYLLTKHANFVKAYAYEPAEPTARLARENLVGNGLLDRVELRQIGLSDKYARMELTYVPDWSTAFSTDDTVLLPHLLQTSSHIDSENPVLDVEVVPASVEFAQIFSAHPDARYVLKCDTQGSEFNMINDLAEANMLGRLDAIIIETHFRDPEEILSLLSAFGFKYEARLDSTVNQVYTIRAWRREGLFNTPLVDF